MPRMTTDITQRFSLDQIDHHEFLDILTLRYKPCWRVSEREITFPAAYDYSIKLRIRHGQVETVSAGKALTEADLSALLEQVEADLKDDRIAEYGREYYSLISRSQVLRPIGSGPDARRYFTKDLFGAGGSQPAHLRVDALAVGRNARVAVNHAIIMTL